MTALKIANRQFRLSELPGLAAAQRVEAEEPELRRLTLHLQIFTRLSETRQETGFEDPKFAKLARTLAISDAEPCPYECLSEETL